MKALVLSFLISNLALSPIVSSTSVQIQNISQNQYKLELQQRISSLGEKVQALLKEKEEKGEVQYYEVFYEGEVPYEEFVIETPPEEKEKEVSSSVNYYATFKTLGYYKEDYKDEGINNRNALIRFQSEHNLVVDGIFGEKTKEAFNKRLEDENFKYYDVVKEAPTKDRWITVNKTKRILTLYRGTEVIKKYPIAQGKTANLTPEGKFTIVTKAINPAWGGAGVAKPVAGGSPQNPLGYRWLGLSHGGGSRYGIHGNNSPLSIGTNASMGCVRMINSDVEELYNLVPTKTIVWIGTDEKLKEWGVDQVPYGESNAK